MGRASALLACVAAAAMLAGCREQLRLPAGSLKDHPAPRAAAAGAERAPDRTADGPSVIDRAKAEQAARCGQRHIEYRRGTLSETEDQKRTADAACAELHKYDYVQ